MRRCAGATVVSRRSTHCDPHFAVALRDPQWGSPTHSGHHPNSPRDHALSSSSPPTMPFLSRSRLIPSSKYFPSLLSFLLLSHPLSSSLIPLSSLSHPSPIPLP